nr:hypothetical protein CFP56_22405 [Quercus suber]
MMGSACKRPARRRAKDRRDQPSARRIGRAWPRNKAGARRKQEQAGWRGGVWHSLHLCAMHTSDPVPHPRGMPALRSPARCTSARPARVGVAPRDPKPRTGEGAPESERASMDALHHARPPVSAVRLVTMLWPPTLDTSKPPPADPVTLVLEDGPARSIARSPAGRQALHWSCLSTELVCLLTLHCPLACRGTIDHPSPHLLAPNAP